MTSTTAYYEPGQSKGHFADFSDTIRLAMLLKNEFEKFDDPEARHEAICELLSSN